MTRKLAPRRIVGILIMIVSALFLIWLLWPRSFAQIIPGFGKKDLHIDADVINIINDENRSISFAPSSPEAKELLDLLSSTRYQRILSLKDWREVKLDYEVHLTFSLGDESDISEYCLVFTGDPLIDFHGSFTSNRTYSVYGGEEFQQRLLDFLLKQEDPAVLSFTG